MTKTFTITGMIVGSLAGGYAPMLWGGSVFSISSIILGAIGGFAGIWIGYKIATRIGL